MIVDLRSDTFTQPSEGMLEAMYKARTGDDVFGEDPTVNELESMAAKLFGKEAALYCTSGTQSNQIGIKVHTQPADEVICEKTSHVYLYEGAGIAYNAGCQVKLLDGVYGKITAGQVAEAINPDDLHKPVSRLVSLENTANRGGGSCYSMESINEIKEVCVANNMALHLDGARLFNALVATKQNPTDYGKAFDSISICLNKGLGCPMGSILIGSADYVKKARRVRKVMGGGLRQAGYMAATGVYALKNNIERLHIDHDHARIVAEALVQQSFCDKLYPVETNIVIVEIKAPHTAPQLVTAFAEKGIRVIAMSDKLLRFVFHLDITPSMVDHTLEVIKSLK